MDRLIDHHDYDFAGFRAFICNRRIDDPQLFRLELWIEATSCHRLSIVMCDNALGTNAASIGMGVELR